MITAGGNVILLTYFDDCEISGHSLNVSYFNDCDTSPQFSYQTTDVVVITFATFSFIRQNQIASKIG
jgi:hypothetical protein